MNRRVPAVFLLWSLLLSPPAFAQTASEAQREAYEKGWNALDAKDYVQAERIFSALYAERATYDVALSLGQAEFQLKKYREAATHLAFGIKNAPPAADPDTLARSKQGLEFVEQRYVATVRVGVDRAGAEIRVDGVRAGTAPLDSEVFVLPGKHSIEASFPGYQTSRRDIQVVASEKLSVTLTLVETQSAGAQPGAPAAPAGEPPAKDDSSGIRPRTVAIIAGGVTAGVALTTLAVFAAKSSAAGSRAEDQLAVAKRAGQAPCSSAASRQSDTCVALYRELDDQTSAGRVANIALVTTGVAALATAIVIFAWRDGGRQEAAGVSARPLADATSAGLLLDGRF